MCIWADGILLFPISNFRLPIADCFELFAVFNQSAISNRQLPISTSRSSACYIYILASRVSPLLKTEPRFVDPWETNGVNVAVSGS